MRTRNDIIFLLYAKISAIIQDYGENYIQSDVYKCSQILYCFVRVFLAVSPFGVNHYSAISNTADGYAYQTELKAMLEEWATQQSVHTVVLSAEMKQQEYATKEIRAMGHTCWSYPINHANMHLSDACLYNFGSALRRSKPATYNELCSLIEKRYELFPSVFVQDLSDLIIFYASDSDKSRKDSFLPPHLSICFFKPTYEMAEEFEQLKQSALAASSQSTNPAFSTPPSRPSHLLWGSCPPVPKCVLVYSQGPAGRGCHSLVRGKCISEICIGVKTGFYLLSEGRSP
ncbi:hypothetical protein DSO57_1001943 [Entomophthora muscae]|uniref:Uncharacterized protein n=1 Tax=Entomophthora muscae TaxID=34485 RepID=A0ACC2UUA3_9FUNG|nr:hypothetical protein DSO57_1001943 [Entomophthora muscae]